jgi:hypothetical protein
VNEVNYDINSGFNSDCTVTFRSVVGKVGKFQNFNSVVVFCYVKCNLLCLFVLHRSKFSTT